MDLSINQLSGLTGKSYRTITLKLDGLPHNKRSKGAMRYNSTRALEPNYAADSEKVALDQARAEQALTQARLNRTRDEALRKERIPLDTTWRRAQFNPSLPQTSTVGLG